MDSKKCNVAQLLGNRIKPTNERFGLWLLLENLADNNLVTDIGRINYIEGEPLLTSKNLPISPMPITAPFCDNIMVVKICDLSDCEDGKQNETPILKREICGAFNLYLRGNFSKFSKITFSFASPTPEESRNPIFNWI